MGRHAIKRVTEGWAISRHSCCSFCLKRLRLNGFEVPRRWFGFYGLPPALEEKRMKQAQMNRKRAQRRQALQDWRAAAIEKRNAGLPLNRIARRVGRRPATAAVELAAADALMTKQAA